MSISIFLFLKNAKEASLLYLSQRKLLSMLNKKQIISYNVQNINRHVFNTLYIWAIVYAERFLYLNFFGFCGIKFSKESSFINRVLSKMTSL